MNCYQISNITAAELLKPPAAISILSGISHWLWKEKTSDLLDVVLGLKMEIGFVDKDTQKHVYVRTG